MIEAKTITGIIDCLQKSIYYKSCEPVEVQTGNKIDLNLLIFAKIKCLVPEIHYLCIWWEATLAKTFRKKKKRCAFLASVKPEKLNNRMTRRHSGSHAIAWAAITISSYKGFLRAYTRRCGIAVPHFVFNL